MITVLTAFFISAIATACVIRYFRIHGIGADSDLSQPQKFHTKPTPRIGGVGYALGLLAVLVLSFLKDSSNVNNYGLLLGSASLAFSAVVHLAGRAHIMHDTASSPLAEFRAANCDYAVRIAKLAIAAGVKRFVYVSSVKVNGEYTHNTPFNERSAPNPCDPYGVSKHEAELALTELAHKTGLELVIVRPPLIYGAGVKANFAKLAQLAAKGLPLPLGAIHNRRSLLYVKNLVGFLILCTHHPKAANETFLLSDGQDVSTTQLLQALARAQAAPSRLLPVPATWLRGAMRLVGKADMAQRLLGNLQVDSSKAQALLGCDSSHFAPYTFEAAVAELFAQAST